MDLSIVLTFISCFFFAITFGQSSSNSNEEVIMHPVLNTQTGMVSGHIPLPSTWKINGGVITGPNAIEIKDFPGVSLQGRPVHSIDQIIQTDFAHNIRNNGAQQLRVIDLPAVAACDQRMYAQYWQALPAQNYHQAKGIEIKDATGKLGIIVVHFLFSQSQYGNFAFFHYNVMTANPQAYEKAKQHYLYGLANFRQNPEAVAAHNRKEQQKSNMSWNAHNQRMRANQQNFESWQRTQQTLSEANDISFEGWKKRNQMNDQGHEKTINGIWEQEAMTNPYNGSQMNVESGYKYYYMNQFGEYFGTNDEFYNPQQDPNVNHLEWRKIKKDTGKN